MPYLQQVIDWIESEQFEFECGEDVNDAFQDIEDKWTPNNRFTIPRLIGNDMPDLMLYLQEQIDDECEDTTETITFTPERIKRDEELQEEIDACKAELSEARKELSEFEDTELVEPTGGIVEGIKRFIRNIFGG